MLEQIFKDQFPGTTVGMSHANGFWREIESAYNNPKRLYHTLGHLNAILEQLSPLKEQIQDWTSVILSIAYHDIVYNTLKRDNEEKSAKLAVKRLSESGFGDVQIEKCREMILATKTHVESQDPDCNYFTDADLSILGIDQKAYWLYTKQIRKEYNYYPDILYRPGRRKVLVHFLEMETIFKTAYFINRYEQQARINIAAELRLLSWQG